jgi:hypothetical protein
MATVKGCYVELKKGDYSRLLYAEGRHRSLREAERPRLLREWKGQLKGTVRMGILAFWET